MAAPAEVRPPSPPRRTGRALGVTGAATRTLLVLAGIALLLGAFAVAFAEPREPQESHKVIDLRERKPARPRRARQPRALEVIAPVKTPASGQQARRQPARPARHMISGWENGIPLAPGKREAARRRAGVIPLETNGRHPRSRGGGRAT